MGESIWHVSEPHLQAHIPDMTCEIYLFFNLVAWLWKALILLQQFLSPAPVDISRPSGEISQNEGNPSFHAGTKMLTWGETCASVRQRGSGSPGVSSEERCCQGLRDGARRDHDFMNFSLAHRWSDVHNTTPC